MLLMELAAGCGLTSRHLIGGMVMFNLPSLATSFIEQGGMKLAAIRASFIGIKYVLKTIKNAGKTDKYGNDIESEWRKYKRG